MNPPAEAEALLKSGDLPGALASFKKASDLEPASARPHGQEPERERDAEHDHDHAPARCKLAAN